MFTIHCTTLHYTALHRTTLHYTALHCSKLQYAAVHWTTLHYTVLHCTTLLSMLYRRGYRTRQIIRRAKKKKKKEVKKVKKFKEEKDRKGEEWILWGIGLSKEWYCTLIWSPARGLTWSGSTRKFTSLHWLHPWQSRLYRPCPSCISMEGPWLTHTLMQDILYFYNLNLYHLE